MKFISLILVLVLQVFASESLIGKQVIFDYKGQRQMGAIGTKTTFKDSQRNVAVTWMSDGKHFGKTSGSEKVNLNAPGVVLEVDSYPVTLRDKKIVLKAGQTIVGKDNQVYQIKAVFPNGEIGLIHLKNDHGKLRSQTSTVVKTADFVDALSVQCLGQHCPGAYVLEENPNQLCTNQKPSYYADNMLTKDSNSLVECHLSKGMAGIEISHVFEDGSIVLRGVVRRRAIGVIDNESADTNNIK